MNNTATGHPSARTTDDAFPAAETFAPNEPKKLLLPCDKNELGKLRAGDEVSLSGPVFSMRDAGHKRCLEALEKEGVLPYNLKGQILFYVGPTPAFGGRAIGSVGPTTAGRMDFATPALMQAGIAGCIGKGKRSPEVREACKNLGCIYFAAVGGIAALLAQHVLSCETIAWHDLGCEALLRLYVKDFPCFVAIDAQGGDLYRSVEEKADVC